MWVPAWHSCLAYLCVLLVFVVGAGAANNIGTLHLDGPERHQRQRGVLHWGLECLVVKTDIGRKGQQSCLKHVRGRGNN
jgi:hypothetical protein